MIRSPIGIANEFHFNEFCVSFRYLRFVSGAWRTRTYVLTATITFSNINFRFYAAYTVSAAIDTHYGHVVCPNRRHFRNRIHKWHWQVSARHYRGLIVSLERVACISNIEMVECKRMRLGHKCWRCAAHTGPCSRAALRRSLYNFRSR